MFVFSMVLVTVCLSKQNQIRNFWTDLKQFVCLVFFLLTLFEIKLLTNIMILLARQSLSDFVSFYSVLSLLLTCNLVTFKRDCFAFPQSRRFWERVIICVLNLKYIFSMLQTASIILIPKSIIFIPKYFSAINMSFIRLPK
jgi:hypothetical protein